MNDELSAPEPHGTRRHKPQRGLTPEQEQERFSTEGKGFLEALRLVVAGGPEGNQDAEREANE